MTTVCPALLPPWYLTTKSTLSPSRSVALPLPSSPHWAPASTMAGIPPTPSCQAPAGLSASSAAAGLLFPWDRAMPVPARPAQQIQAAVIAGAGVGVGRDHLLLAQRAFGERRPCGGIAGEPRPALGRISAGFERAARSLFVGQERRRRSGEQ